MPGGPLPLIGRTYVRTLTAWCETARAACTESGSSGIRGSMPHSDMATIDSRATPWYKSTARPRGSFACGVAPDSYSVQSLVEYAFKVHADVDT
eukprot:3506586-Pleurochrysis_carterae.AAC.2